MALEAAFDNQHARQAREDLWVDDGVATVVYPMSRVMSIWTPRDTRNWTPSA